jgi:hypothetical protein
LGFFSFAVMFLGGLFRAIRVSASAAYAIEMARRVPVINAIISERTRNASRRWQ